MLRDNRLRIAYLLILAGTAICRFSPVLAEEPPPAANPIQPVIRTGVRAPTQDKPQSKLWFAHGFWWAWLPTLHGSAIWQRTGQGWQEVGSLTNALQGLPGQADVLSDGDRVWAVLVEPNRLGVACLDYRSDLKSYAFATPPVGWDLPPVNHPSHVTETATIARDSQGRLWIAWDRETKMWASYSLNVKGSEWSSPLALSEPTTKDDLCEIIALPGQVGLLWSDQRNDAIFFRARRDCEAVDQWEDVEIVEQGERTADDHLHAVISADGTLYVASKNSVDEFNKPQLVLRIRHPDGSWENRPYADLTPQFGPTRPISLLGGIPQRLYLLHTVYTPASSRQRNFIVMTDCALPSPCVASHFRPLLKASVGLNNVTGCKHELPPDHPWIILAGGGLGDVYEAEIPRTTP